jgi:iron complex transport system ATP-binding protein
LELKLTVDDLSFNYGSISILNDVNFTVGQGEMLSLVGPNGSGKSTLLKCLNGILKTSHNTVLLDDKCISKINLKEMSKIVGYVPQSSNSTFPFTVFDIVLMGRKPYINWRLSEKDNEIVGQILDFLGIGNLAMRHFTELSGGEQQKVVIARALAQQPQLLLLDEPTSSLDIKYQLEILCILQELAQTEHCSVIVSMHDLNLASRFCDKMIMLKKGQIFAAGSPEMVLTEKNIEAVYDIKAQVTSSLLNKPQITPMISSTNRIKDFVLPAEITVKLAKKR